ncbi:MAG TPA: hypothetical protein VGH28_01640 [Polyangiaceae bacterium]|jgi:hypothetical protein
MNARSTLVAALVLGLGAPASAEGTPVFVTSFDVTVSIGGNPFHPPIPTPAGMRFMLPVAFDSWNCSSTPRSISNDGSQYYFNIICDPVGHDGFVGVSVSCPVHAGGLNTGGFFLRTRDAAGNLAEASLYGTCVTQARAAPAAHLGAPL